MHVLLLLIYIEMLGFCSILIQLFIRVFILYLIQIRRNLPDVLLATMNILYTKYRSTRSVALIKHLVSFFFTAVELSKIIIKIF